MTNPVLDNIKTRRVVRELSEQGVEREQIEAILEAARWAPSGGNLRPNRYIVIEDAETRRLIRLVAPGMFQKAPLLILICTNWQVVAEHQLQPGNRALLIDVGTAAQTMMLAAHALGLASGPVTSYSKEAVKVILNLPNTIRRRCSFAWAIKPKARNRACALGAQSLGAISRIGNASKSNLHSDQGIPKERINNHARTLH